MKTYRVKVNGKVYEVELEAVSESNGNIQAAKPAEKPAPQAAAPAPTGGQSVVAPIAGKIVNVKVKVGDVIKVGDVVATIEAMKLENEVPSPIAGKVASIAVKAGDAVENKSVLLTLE